MNKLDPKTSALLLIDVINHFDFDGSGKLLRHALPAAKKIARLKQRLREAGVPVIYVNDNFSRWTSDFSDLVEHCKAPERAGRAITELLMPDREDYFVLKPKHSGFYSTSLELLLDFLGAKTLVLTGFAGDICVIYTANDAYMREYELVVPSDCIASESPASPGDVGAHACPPEGPGGGVPLRCMIVFIFSRPPAPTCGAFVSPSPSVRRKMGDSEFPQRSAAGARTRFQVRSCRAN